MRRYGTITKERTRGVGKKLRDPGRSYGSDAITDVNLSIKVPLELRQHWVAEAKREGTSLTAVIMEALTKRFGGP